MNSMSNIQSNKQGKFGVTQLYTIAIISCAN